MAATKTRQGSQSGRQEQDHQQHGDAQADDSAIESKGHFASGGTLRRLATDIPDAVLWARQNRTRSVETGGCKASLVLVTAR